MFDTSVCVALTRGRAVKVRKPQPQSACSPVEGSRAWSQGDVEPQAEDSARFLDGVPNAATGASLQKEGLDIRYI